MDLLWTNPSQIQLCDVCELSPAALLCKADNAALCLSCDHHVHSANHLSGRHRRTAVHGGAMKSFFHFQQDIDSVVPIIEEDPSSYYPSAETVEVCVVPECNQTAEVGGGGGEETAAGTAAVRLRGWEREERVRRYREKRKRRSFVKRIRYASRKAYAEKRPRIKGRFVKRCVGNGGDEEEEEEEEEDDGLYVGEEEYGEVPIIF